MKIQTKMLKKFISILCAATMVASGAVVSVGANPPKKKTEKGMKNNLKGDNLYAQVFDGKNKGIKEIQIKTKEEEKGTKVKAKKEKVVAKRKIKFEDKEKERIKEQLAKHREKYEKDVKYLADINKKAKLERLENKEKNKNKNQNKVSAETKTKPFWLKCVEKEKKQKQEEAKEAKQRKAKIQKNMAELNQEVKDLQKNGDPEVIKKMIQEFNCKSQLKLEEKEKMLWGKFEKNNEDIELLSAEVEKFYGSNRVSLRGAVKKLKAIRDKSWSKLSKERDAINLAASLLEQQYNMREQLETHLNVLSSMQTKVLNLKDKQIKNENDKKERFNELLSIFKDNSCCPGIAKQFTCENLSGNFDVALKVIGKEIDSYDSELAKSVCQIEELEGCMNETKPRYDRDYNSLRESLENLERSVETEIKGIRERIAKLEANEENYNEFQKNIDKVTMIQKVYKGFSARKKFAKVLEEMKNDMDNMGMMNNNEENNEENYKEMENINLNYSNETDINNYYLNNMGNYTFSNMGNDMNNNMENKMNKTWA